jgi:hypothetical protein
MAIVFLPFFAKVAAEAVLYRLPMIQDLMVVVVLTSMVLCVTQGEHMVDAVQTSGIICSYLMDVEKAPAN